MRRSKRKRKEVDYSLKALAPPKYCIIQRSTRALQSSADLPRKQKPKSSTRKKGRRQGKENRAAKSDATEMSMDNNNVISALQPPADPLHKLKKSTCKKRRRQNPSEDSSRADRSPRSNDRTGVTADSATAPRIEKDTDMPQHQKDVQSTLSTTHTQKRRGAARGARECPDTSDVESDATNDDAPAVVVQPKESMDKGHSPSTQGSVRNDDGRSRRDIPVSETKVGDDDAPVAVPLGTPMMASQSPQAKRDDDDDDDGNDDTNDSDDDGNDGTDDSARVRGQPQSAARADSIIHTENVSLAETLGRILSTLQPDIDDVDPLQELKVLREQFKALREMRETAPEAALTGASQKIATLELVHEQLTAHWNGELKLMRTDLKEATRALEDRDAECARLRAEVAALRADAEKRKGAERMAAALQTKLPTPPMKKRKRKQQQQQQQAAAAAKECVDIIPPSLRNNKSHRQHRHHHHHLVSILQEMTGLTVVPHDDDDTATCTKFSCTAACQDTRKGARFMIVLPKERTDSSAKRMSEDGDGDEDEDGIAALDSQFIPRANCHLLPAHLRNTIALRRADVPALVAQIVGALWEPECP